MLLISSTFETLIPCLFGDNLHYENEQFVNAVSSCNWVDQKKEFKEALIFFIRRSQKPLKILAGGYIPCSINTFVQIQKVAYSIFVLFKK